MADADTGDVLFARGQDDEEDEDIWDDSALIKAYDNAVSMMKHKVAAHNGTALPDKVIPPPAGKLKSKKRSKKNKKKRKWKVGDMCRAKFSEDGLVYEAEILSVDEDADTCFVKYTGYGNEEEQNMADIMCTKNRRKNESDIDGTDSQSGTEWRSNRSSTHMRPPRRPSDHSIKPPSFWPAPPGADSGMPQFAMPSFPPSFPGFPGFPPQHSHPYPSSSRVPPMPPPPPPMCEDMSEAENEAMCSMLMSWYMSGYHTGYYQGLQQGRKESGTSSPYANR